MLASLLEKTQTGSIVRAWGGGGGEGVAGRVRQPLGGSFIRLSRDPGSYQSRVAPPEALGIRASPSLPLLPGPSLSVSCPLRSELGLQAGAWLAGAGRFG